MSKFNFNKNSGNVNSYESNQNNKNSGVTSNLKPAQKTLLIVIAIFVIMLIAYSGFMAFSGKTRKEETKGIAEESVSEELLKNKTFQGLELRDIEIESTSSLTHLMANITNTVDTEFPAGMVDIVFLDSSNKEMGRVPTYIDAVAPKGEIRIDTVIDKNYKNAHTFKVEAKQ